MAAHESAYPSLLQGVSQQVPTERLPGQVGAQLNMLSDLVTNIRRRPGLEYAFNVPFTSGTTNSVVAAQVDLGGVNVHVLVNTITGVVTVLSATYSVLATLPANSYLIAAARRSIRMVTITDEVYILNTEKVPTETAPAAGIPPSRRGYFYITAGAYNKQFSVTVTTSVASYTASYSTPQGNNAGDAAVSTPAYIALQLANLITAQAAAMGITAVQISDAYCYVESGATVTVTDVTTSSGDAYVQASKQAYTSVAGNLPARLPSMADGFIMAVGDMKLPQYYKYISATSAWLESGAYGSPVGFGNMPLELSVSGGVWSLAAPAYEGRLAGDATSNESPAFLSGITGMGVYQGRLAILARDKVRLSAAGRPHRFYRSSVASIIDSDPIEVGASANSSAAYEYAVPFQKDLLLFSSKYQALIPAANVAITPRTATVVLTSNHESDMTSSPVSLGRTMMYCTPRSTDFFGAMEMVSSQNTDSQYISVDATPHLPKYLGGRCRFAVSSTVSGLVLFAPTGDLRSLIVHEYSWDGDKKVQQAWHQWTFQYDVAGAYFAGGVVVVLFVKNGVLVGCTVDPRRGVLSSTSERRPYLDLYSTCTIVNHVVTPPAWLLTFDPAALASVKLSVLSGAMAGEEVGCSVTGSTLTTVTSWPSGTVGLGFPFKSSITPTPPVLRDYKELPITSAKYTILRFMAGTKKSSQYEVAISDAHSGTVGGGDVGTLYWSSTELVPGTSKLADESVAVIPARTDARTTQLEIFTTGTGELNITTLEWVGKYTQKVKRR